ncbi:hypothetical protein NLG97_g4331 [Lecanicillium saksenae]|uniref:Uncharacterized protein n=1 Tax=Lecanicillium saksenae TaxID=468837 RepID=A0ACC1QVL1_9HYPO|nr:hypothetical protein NLG97_g4331 [Lecanicillium saksenae]
MADPYGIGSSAKPLWPEEGMYLQRGGTSHPQQLFPASQDSVPDKGPDALAENHVDGSHSHPFGEYPSYSHGYDPGSSRFRTRTSPSAPSIMTDTSEYRGMQSSDHLWRSRLDTRGDVGGISHYGPGAVAPAATGPLGGMGHGDGDEYSDEGDVGEGESEGIQQTAAERLASRRKMKRFRLTHQQTRFLMSEFAKQPHPDAAHRDRLSREIPGLSPRQVQVWFQNRRAKIKRLNADDRERVVQMRAVPENFDNVQALHSPYGAVQAYDGSITHAPSHHQQHMYGSQHQRTLMVDVRRTEAEHPMQSTGLTPVFGGVGFGQNHVPGILDTSSMISSPSTFGSNDRYTYGARQPGVGVLDASKGSATGSPVNESDHRSGPRPLRPAGLADPLSRGRSASLQSAMGSSMYWRGSGLGDVAEVQDPAPEHGSEGQTPSLHTSTSGMGLNSLFYGGDTTTQASGTTGGMGVHHDQLRRNRAASASFSQENRGQFSDMEQQSMLSPIRTDITRPAASTPAGPTYTTSYGSPLPFPGSAGVSNARILEPREHMSQFAYHAGDTSNTGVQAFPVSSQPGEDVGQRPFFQETQPGQSSVEALPYGESTEGSDAVKQE